MAYVQELALMGDFVALVCRVTSVSQRFTRDSLEPFVELQGVDMAGDRVGPLRLWQYSEDEVHEGMYCIVRGLKVCEERVWDPWKQSYQPSGSQTRILECKDRTAVEDITGVQIIKDCFIG